MANIQSLPLLLKELRLTAVAKVWPGIVEKSIKEAWEPAQFLAELCEIETNHRYENRLKR
jgi:DNA replication protein DnaC